MTTLMKRVCVCVCLIISGPIVRFIKVRISSQDSALEENEAAVQDNILKQVSQRPHLHFQVSRIQIKSK